MLSIVLFQMIYVLPRLILAHADVKAEASAQCSRVPSLWNGDLVGNCRRFVGAECRFSCRTPYKLRGNSMRTCQEDGTWSGEAPSCELGQCTDCDASPHFMKQQMIQCPSLIAPPGGTVEGICSPGQVGSSCIFRCPAQSVLDGQPVLVCLPSGTWSDNPPRCSGTTGNGGTCPILTPPSGGRLIGSCTRAVTGDICQLVCISGFRPSDTRVLVCQQNGVWSHALPTCIGGTQCPSIVVPQGTTMGSCNPGVPGQSCSVTCLPGYTLTGSGTITCQENGVWSGTIPSCTQGNTCPALFPPANGATTGSCTQASVGSRCSFTCFPGYSLTGQQTLICGANGQWSSSTPFCSQSGCPSLPPPNNGYQTGSCTQASVGQSCSFICQPGFQLVGQATLVCQGGGTWSGSPPICTMSSCPALVAPANSIISGSCSQATVGSSCIFSCLPGYELIGQSVLICQAGSHWSSPTPICSRSVRMCPSLIAPTNGYLIGSCSPGEVGQSCIFGCNENYVLDGQRTLVCQTSGLWNGNTPRCVRSGGGENCPALVPPANGEFVECDNRSGGRCVVNCFRGYVRSGSRVRTCLPQGTWSGFAPVCVRRTVYGYKVVPLWTFLFG